MRKTPSGLEFQTAPGNAEKAFAFLLLLLSLGAFMNLTVTGPGWNREHGNAGNADSSGCSCM